MISYVDYDNITKINLLTIIFSLSLDVQYLGLAVLVVAAGIAISFAISKSTTSISDAAEVPVPRLRLEPGLYNVTCRSTKKSFVDGCSVHRGTDCARVVMDDFLSEDESAALIRFAETAFSISGGGAGPVSVFDGVKGATSMGDRFVNVFQMVRQSKANLAKLEKADADAKGKGKEKEEAASRALEQAKTALKTFKREDIEIFDRVTQRFIDSVGRTFGIRNALATTPSFIARLKAGAVPRNIHDEYWHTHVDTNQCKELVIIVAN